MLGRVQSRHGVHQHREEGHDHDDGRLGLPVEAEPHHHDRRDADDRQRRNQVADRQEPALQEADAVDQDRDEEAGAGADDEAGNHRLQEGLAEVRPKRRQRTDELRPDRRGRRQEDGRHAHAANDHLPQEEKPGAEEERHHHLHDHGLEPVHRANRGEAVHEQPADQPAADGNRPKAGSGRRWPRVGEGRSPGDRSRRAR